MPAYPIPPWLQGTPRDAGEHYLNAYRTGAAIAEAQQRSQRDSALAVMEMQLKQEDMKMRQMREDQKMAMDKAYNDTVLGLQRDKLQLQATTMAKKFQAQSAYRDELTKGGDPMALFLKYGPEMGATPAAMAQMALKSKTPTAEPFFASPLTDKDGNPIPNAWTYPAANLRGRDVHWAGAPKPASFGTETQYMDPSNPNAGIARFPLTEEEVTRLRNRPAAKSTGFWDSIFGAAKEKFNEGAQFPQKEERISVLDSNGKSGTIPRDQLEEALQSGFKLNVPEPGEDESPPVDKE